MPPPDVDLLTDIVTPHLGAAVAAECDDMIRQFAAKAESTRALAADQLMNAIFIVTRENRAPFGGTGPGDRAAGEAARSRPAVIPAAAVRLGTRFV